jgi:heme/copper-type cytochrome/quinol oxidase subunit 2
MNPQQIHLIKSIIAIALFVFSFSTMAYHHFRQGKATRNRQMIGLGIMYLSLMIIGLVIVAILYVVNLQNIAW